MIISTTGSVVVAANALNELRGQMLSKQAAKGLFHMRRVMAETLEFYNEQLREITERLGVEISPTGQIMFGNDAEKRDKFLSEIRDMENTEATLDVDVLDLTGEDIRISDDFVGTTGDFVKI